LHHISKIQVVGNIFFNIQLSKLNTVHLQSSAKLWNEFCGQTVHFSFDHTAKSRFQTVGNCFSQWLGRPKSSYKI